VPKKSNGYSGVHVSAVGSDAGNSDTESEHTILPEVSIKNRRKEKRVRGATKSQSAKKSRDMPPIIVLNSGVHTLNAYGFSSFVNMLLIDTHMEENAKALSSVMRPTYLYSTKKRYLLLLKVMIADSAAPYGEYGCVMYSGGPDIADEFG
jgi:hypothetical protein